VKILPVTPTGAFTIEQARKAKAIKMQRVAAQQPRLAAVENDTPKKLVLPLDHGPRAQSLIPPNNAIRSFE